MANISTYLNKILSAIYGEEVRGAIHDSIKAMNEEKVTTSKLADGAVTLEKISPGADVVTGTRVASTDQTGVIKLYAKNGQNRSGLYVGEDGACYVTTKNGLYRDGAGGINIAAATEEEIDTKQEGFKPIVPATLEHAVQSVTGKHSDLKTVDKTSVVAAVNELNSKIMKMHSMENDFYITDGYEIPFGLYELFVVKNDSETLTRIAVNGNYDENGANLGYELSQTMEMGKVYICYKSREWTPKPDCQDGYIEVMPLSAKSTTEVDAVQLLSSIHAVDIADTSNDPKTLTITLNLAGDKTTDAVYLFKHIGDGVVFDGIAFAPNSIVVATTDALGEPSTISQDGYYAVQFTGFTTSDKVRVLKRWDLNTDSIVGNLIEDNSSVSALEQRITALTSRVAELESMEDQSARYTNLTPTVQAHGGVAAGTTFNNMPITQVLDKILYPYVAPVVTAKVAAPSNGGTFEKGTTKNVTSIQITVTRKSAKITKAAVYNGATEIAAQTVAETHAVNTGAAAQTFTFAVNLNVTANTTYTAKVTDAEGNTTTANTGAFTFVYPYYAGVIAATAQPDAAAIKALSKKVETKGIKTISYTAANQKMVFASPVSYGEIKTITDPNGFNVTDTFTKSTVSVTGVDGTAQNYYVYTSDPTTVSAFNIKFAY